MHPNGSDWEGFVVGDEEIDYESIDGVDLLDYLPEYEVDNYFEEEDDDE
jgi:hypothetical protein